MNNEPDPKAPSRRIRRHFDPKHPLKHHPSILLGHEDAESFQAVRDAVNEEFTPKTNYQQQLAEIAAQNMWRALRSAAAESAHIDIQIAEQAPQVDRIYTEIDGHARTALVLADPAIAHTKRLLNHEETVYTHRHFLAVDRLKRCKS
ncbi:MAG: hypothetical protein IPP47_15830 [Bryobacterales bacterium]|nr:hypothetical protein [Bryobacterales bacterium]